MLLLAKFSTREIEKYPSLAKINTREIVIFWDSRNLVHAKFIARKVAFETVDSVCLICSSGLKRLNTILNYYFDGCKLLSCMTLNIEHLHARRRRGRKFKYNLIVK